MDEKEINSLFDKILEIMNENLSEAATKKWIKPLKITAVTGDSIEFAAPNQFIRDWISDRYIKILEFAVSEAVGKTLNIIVSVNKFQEPIKSDNYLIENQKSL